MDFFSQICSASWGFLYCLFCQQISHVIPAQNGQIVLSLESKYLLWNVRFVFWILMPIWWSRQECKNITFPLSSRFAKIIFLLIYSGFPKSSCRSFVHFANIQPVSLYFQLQSEPDKSTVTRGIAQFFSPRLKLLKVGELWMVIFIYILFTLKIVATLCGFFATRRWQASLENHCSSTCFSVFPKGIVQNPNNIMDWFFCVCVTDKQIYLSGREYFSQYKKCS